MIAGETEYMIDELEDDMFFGSKARARRQARSLKRKASHTRAEKQERKKQFFKNVGSKIKENGGLAGVSSTLSNVVGMFKKKDSSAEPVDYQVNMGQPEPVLRDKKMTTGMYVVGGAVVVGLVVLGISKMNKNKG